jgi:hypothetical protein
MAMDGRYAENAGAFFGRCLDGRTPQNKRLVVWAVTPLPEMQEQFPAVRR